MAGEVKTRGLKGTAILAAARNLEPEARLLMAVVYIAVDDAQRGDADAAKWLLSDNCDHYCDLLSITSDLRGRLSKVATRTLLKA